MKKYNYKIIENAKSPHDLFVIGDFSKSKKIYKELARTCHPDIVKNDQRAEEAFKKLSNLYKQYTDIINGCVKVEGFQNLTLMYSGCVSSIFTTDDGRLIKIVGNEADNDLMDRQEKNLNFLLSKSIGDPNWARKYLPEIEDVFTISGKKSHLFKKREKNLADLYTASQIFSMKPDLDFRHVVWMVNRVCSILGFVHSFGIVHGAILPNHLLFRPADHGLILIDWTASIEEAEPQIPYKSKKYNENYPKEVEFGKTFLTTDVFMLSKIFYPLNAPKRFRDVFDWALADSPNSRPTIHQFHERWKQVAKEIYGDPKFVPLEMVVN